MDSCSNPDALPSKLISAEHPFQQGDHHAGQRGRFNLTWRVISLRGIICFIAWLLTLWGILLAVLKPAIAQVAVDDTFSLPQAPSTTLVITEVYVADPVALLFDDDPGDHGPLTLTGFIVDGDPTLYPSNTNYNFRPLLGGANIRMIIRPNGRFAIRQRSTFVGDFPSITYFAEDTVGTQVSATFQVTITPNSPPSAEVDIGNVDEDGLLNVSAPGLLSNDTDPDGNNISVTQFEIEGVTYPAGTIAALAQGSILINSNGGYNFTPAPDFNGTFPTITYMIADEHVNQKTDTAPLVITVNDLNDPPETAMLPTISVGDPAGAVAITLVGSDVDGLVDEFEIAELLAANIHGSLYRDAGLTQILSQSDIVTASANQAFIYYAPQAGFNGNVSFEYASVDDDGAADATPATVAIFVNDNPEFTSTAITDVNKEEAYSYSVMATDTDPGQSVSISAFSKPTWLTLTDHGGGLATLSGIPAAPDVGDHNVILQASDGLGGNSFQHFTLTVIETNEAPTAVDDSFAGSEDMQMAGNVLDNDVEPDGDAMTALLVTDVDNGLLVLNTNGTFTYDPAPNFNGTDSFTYLANDGELNSGSPATVTLAIAAENDPPTAVDDTFVLNEDTPITGNVLSNDTDPENQSLTATVVGATTNGFLSFNSDGSFTYTPDTDFHGTDGFTYLANDGDDDSAPASVVLNVTGLNDAPQINSPTAANEITIAVAEGETAVTDVDATDDAGAGGLTFALSPGDDSEFFGLDESSGIVSFKAEPDFENPIDADGNNIYVFTIVVTDGDGASDSLLIHASLQDVDEISPTATIAAPAEAREPFPVTVTFSEDVLGFEETDLAVKNGNVIDFAGSGAEYTLTIVPGDTGAITLSIGAGVAVDATGNSNWAVAPVAVNFINEEAVVEETKKVIGQLLTQRNRITMNYKPTIERRLQRLSGTYLSNGEINAFGFSYRDSRLPMRFSYKENEVSFAYSYLQSQVVTGTAPSLRGQFGTPNAGSHNAPTIDAPPSLINSHSPSRPVDDKESDAIHAFLLGGKLEANDGENSKHFLYGETDPALALGVYPQPQPRRPINDLPRQHDPRIDVWIEGTYGQFDIDQNQGSFGVAHVGVDYLFTPDLMLGASAQMDWLEAQSTVTGGGSTGNGFMIGPYVTARLAPKLLFDGRFSWGRSKNRVTPSGDYTDEFDSERWLVSGALIGNYQLTDELSLSPEARLSWHREDSDSYIDGLEVEIPESRIETGSFEFGPTLRGSFKLDEERVLQPSLGIKGVWTFAQNVESGAFSEQPEISQTGLRARVEAGVDVLTPQSHSLSLSGFYDGLGEEDYESWGGNLKIRISY